MQPLFPEDQVSIPLSYSTVDSSQSHSPKTARPVLEGIFAFPPNRDTLGGTAYLIVGASYGVSLDGLGQTNDRHSQSGNILIDCPAWEQSNIEFLQAAGGVKFLFITHRGVIGKAREISAAFNCEILIQEQEAYLLPGLKNVTTFHQELMLAHSCQAIWTPGHSPGAACLYYPQSGGVLFSGRHLLPNPKGEPLPLRTSKTFHWQRQLQSVKLLLERFTPDTLHYICPGANTGFLRGKRAIAQAYDSLANIDLLACARSQPLI